MKKGKAIHLPGSKRLKSILRAIFMAAFIAVILYEGRLELASIKLGEIVSTLESLPVHVLILFMAGGFLSVSLSSVHDFIVSKGLSVRLPNAIVFKIGLIANTLNNISGGIASGGVRGVLYNREGVPSKEAVYYNVLTVTSFSSGLSLLTLATLLNLKSIHPVFERYEFIWAAVAVIVFYAPLFFLINGSSWLREKILGENSRETASFRLLGKLFAASVIEWTVATLFFSAISLYFSPGTGFADVLSVFVIASVIGVVSLLPGALGAFDVTLLLGMTSVGIASHEAVAALMMFRVFYHIVPLAVAMIISAPQLVKWLRGRSSARTSGDKTDAV